ncbi:MAG: ProQ/FinO family protein, partial [Pseudomonadota bacterium]
MNKKWSSNNVRSVMVWLEKRWPDRFAPGPDRKPLALDIHKEILKFRSELPELSRRTLDEALKRHMTSHGYLYGMLKHKHRVNLAGSDVEPISETHRHWAAQLLKKKQKDAQRTGKGRKRQVVSGNRGKNPLLDKRPARKVRDAVSPAASPVIRYKQRRRRTV